MYQMAVEGFAILQLDEHGMTLGRGEEAKGELDGGMISACAVSEVKRCLFG